jgi:hypothetical protein
MYDACMFQRSMQAAPIEITGGTVGVGSRLRP